MWIKTSVYIKIEKTTFEENSDKKYTATLTIWMYRDEAKWTLLAKEEVKIENLSLEQLSLESIYKILMDMYVWSTFI